MTLVVIEVMTDNRNRSAAEIRRLFVKNGGQLGGGGSAAWAFEHKGLIRIDRADLSEEALFEMAVGAGAEDLRAEDETWVVVTARETLLTVVGALEAEGLELRGARLEHIPKSRKVMGGEDGEAMLQLLEALDEHDDVQRVFSDFEPDDDLLAGLDET